MKRTYFFRNIICLVILAITVLQACKKDNERPKSLPDRMEILDTKSKVNGNLVESLVLSATNTFTLSFKNAPTGTSAVISAEAVNGISIPATTVELNGTSSVNVPLTGKPTTDGTFVLVVNIKVNGTTYVCSKEFYVDLATVTAIDFALAETPLLNVNKVTDIDFDIYPKSTVFTIVPSPNLTAEIINVSPTKRTLRITPTAQFTTGTVAITATFMAIAPVTRTLSCNAFAAGAGTTAAPFEIPDADRMNRIAYALSGNFKLTSDFTQTTATTSTSTFNGTVDGNGKTITGLTITSSADKSGLFAELGPNAMVKNLILKNVNITGQNNTAALAGINRGSVSTVTVSGTINGGLFVGGISGTNYGSITTSDVNGLTIKGLNSIGSLTGGVNTGSSQTSNVVLVLPDTFPTEVYGIASAKTVDFVFAPSDGTIAVLTTPALLTAAPVSGQQKLTLTPQAGFLSGDLQISMQKNNLSAVRTVKIFSKQAGSFFDGGDGSVASPYIISNESALDYVRNDGTKNYKIVANIALTKPWTPIPTFSGTLDGGKFKVTGLTINSTTANDGFINTNTGTIKDIQFLNVDCKTNAAFGVITGKTTGGTIQNVVVTGSVISTNTGDLLGGISGELSAGGKLTQCYTNLNISASCGMIGGIAGRLTTSTGAITEISYCTTTGSLEITASKNRIAGILGRAEGTVSGGIIKNCLSTVNITATVAAATTANGIGGIFGADQNANIVPIDQCMFSGSISAGFSIGGIAGVGSTITNCIVKGKGPLATQPMLSAASTTPATGNIGGIAGTNKTKLENCVVREVTIKSVITPAGFPNAGIASTYQNNGYTKNSFVANTSIEGSNTAPNWDNNFRISGTAANGTGVNSSNFVGTGVTIVGRTSAITNDLNGLDGQVKTQAELTQSFFQGIGYDFAIWKIDTDGYLSLKNVGYNGTLPTP
ncbi:MAG: hypothetical protein P0Y49_20940 [Candidatus Pedobacter colombiensis]|uniref:GLUG domain-containing protein n=1 Tax=Candidatus Pedobacter colombiensis TaxID=3121371 RepID=A0AAJ6B6J3_9SPHI|nr:hypothetical protein [Pedobacter sp.]WEK19245.1 MAG: hypothetical protein P0Y49_20940 [Pedobacter sp.]